MSRVTLPAARIGAGAGGPADRRGEGHLQATLLGLATAVILALVSALIGPIFFPWTDYRTSFEAELTRLTGLPVRTMGAIDVRLLPVPKVTLTQIEIGGAQSPVARIGALDAELKLGALMRGETRLSELRLLRPDVTLGLDRAGRLSFAVDVGALDPEALSVDRLVVENGRATLGDAASGGALVLQNIDFSGELRSLAGPVKGDGSATIRGHHYPYRLNLSRPGDDGAIRMRLALDPIDGDMMEADIALTLAKGVPKFDGTLSAARAVTLARGRGQSLIQEPWKVTSRVRGDPAGALLEQIEFQYGPEDRAVRLRGDARVMFGARPRLDGVLSSPSIDIDRMLGLPDELRRKPKAVVKALAQSFGGGRLPLPVKIGLSSETVTFAGANLMRVSGDLRIDSESWDIEALDFRAPGLSRVQLSGRLTPLSGGAVSFKGPVRIDATDPRSFIGWLSDRPESGTSEPLQLSGEVTLGQEEIGVERLRAELDRVAITGRLAYRWAAGGQGARIEADLRAPELDADRAAPMFKAALGDAGLDWPREGRLALDIGRATIAGVEARGIGAKMWLDANGLMVERLAVADFGGAALSGSGRIDMSNGAPRGTMIFDLDARRLDGPLALLDRFAPRAGGLLRRAIDRNPSAKLNMTLSLEDATQSAADATRARFSVDGRLGDLRLALGGGGTRADNTAVSGRASGTVDADDGAALAALLGIDKLVFADKRAARLRLNVNGRLDGDLRIDAAVSGAGMEGRADGTARLFADADPSADLRLDVTALDLRPLRASAPGAPLPSTFTTRLAVSKQGLTLDQLKGSVAGTSVRGRLSLGFDDPHTLGGDLTLDRIDLPSLASLYAGLPETSGGAWSADPFGPRIVLPARGQVTFKADKARLTSSLTAEAARGVLMIRPDEAVLDGFEASLADGRVAGQLALARDGRGLSARVKLSMTQVDASRVLPQPASAPIAGSLTAEANLEGTGLSPAALLGALGGTGSFILRDASLGALDPRAFDAVIRAVDGGLPFDANRVRERTAEALAAGRLSVPSVSGTIAVSGGQAILGTTRVAAQATELTLGGSLHLPSAALDARLQFAPVATDGNTRPSVTIALKGPLTGPQRSLDVAAFSSWLALRAVEQQAKRLESLQEMRANEARADEARAREARSSISAAPGDERADAPAQPPLAADKMTTEKIAPAIPGGDLPKSASPATPRSPVAAVSPPLTAVPPVTAPVILPHVGWPPPGVPRVRAPARAAAPPAPRLPAPVDIRPAPRIDALR